MAAILRVKDENGNIVSIPAIKGDKGEKGEKGDRGLPGSGGVPDGGTTGQVLAKNSDADGDAGWKDISGYLSEKLDKNQGTANSGKFLGIGADGIVVPTDVGGGSEWVTLFNGTIATEEAVNSMSADLLKSCEGMNEFLVWYTNTKNTVETPGNDNSEVAIGKANYGYGRFGDLTSDNEKIVHLLLTDSITYSYVIDTRGNSMQFNTGTGTGGWSSNKANPDYNKVKIACFSGTYIGTISLKIYGR